CVALVAALFVCSDFPRVRSLDVTIADAHGITCGPRAILLGVDAAAFTVGEEGLAPRRIATFHDLRSILRAFKAAEPQRQVVVVQAVDGVGYERLVAVVDLLHSVELMSTGIVIDQEPAFTPDRWERRPPTEEDGGYGCC